MLNFMSDLEIFLMRAFLGIVLTVWLTLLAGQPALADKRVALVIGNSSYRNVAKLSNPANDAAAVAAMFKSAGFDTVESKLNLTVSELRKTLRDFGNRSRDADVAVIYYAGHGIELDGTNYLIPVDATLETDTDVLDETLSLDRVLVAVEPAKQLRLVILDACRDNPFAKSMKRTIASRAIGRGLAKVEPSSPNTMIAFAAKAGSTASDGDSKNSPFAAALVNHLTKPGLDLRKAFGFVRDDVLKATGNAQEPFVYGSLGGNDVTLVPAAPAAASRRIDRSRRHDAAELRICASGRQPSRCGMPSSRNIRPASLPRSPRRNVTGSPQKPSGLKRRTRPRQPRKSRRGSPSKAPRPPSRPGRPNKPKPPRKPVSPPN